MMSAILSSVPPAPVVAGLGNFVGRGEEISRYWEDQGNGHDA
jgi:hypothetical protein